MRGNDAYAVLGLRPGAERTEIDQAYRRLIKRYHPDSAGGDASRAAEINRAYSELRARPRQAVRPRPAPPPRPAVVPTQAYSRAPRSKWRMPVFAAVMVAVAALVTTSAMMTQPDRTWRGSSVAGAFADSDPVRPSIRNLSLEEPLATELIEGSVRDAQRLLDAEDPVAAAAFSRDCLSRLSARPSLPLFDSCASYDEAIALLGAGNPLFESGPFNPLAVTARQVGAARLLSVDDFEAETRLQQIRSRVHMALLPGIPDSTLASARRVAQRATRPRYVTAPPSARRTPLRVEPRREASRPPVYVPSRQIAPQPVPTRPSVASKPPAPPASAPAAATPPKPAWQQPMKPAWQRPLPVPPAG